MSRAVRRRLVSTGDTTQGVFDPEDNDKVKYTRLGVWDLYEQKQSAVPRVAIAVPGLWKAEELYQAFQGFPYAWRMMKDVLSIPGMWLLLFFYIAFTVAASFVPAIELWYKAKLLDIINNAVEQRAVDKSLLFNIAASGVLCSVAKRLLGFGVQRLSMPINIRIRQYYSVHIVHSMVRLDVPTYDDIAVQKQLEASLPSPRGGGSSIAWDVIQSTAGVATATITLFSQLSVLYTVLSSQEDAYLLAIFSISETILPIFDMKQNLVQSSGVSVWAATTRDESYVRMQGYKHLVSDKSHRQELVAGGMKDYVLNAFKQALSSVNGDAGEFWEVYNQYTQRQRLSIRTLLQDPLKELPQIVFTLRAVQKPASIPVSIASLNLIQNVSRTFVHSLYALTMSYGNVMGLYSRIRQLYEMVNIPNRVIDGVEPFPEDQRSLRNGISVEFRRVSFQYPGSETFALRDVSFKIEQGQLCVIVGTNGSGKSTILKLLTRIYDPTEGMIFVDDRDIRTLRLDDLRRCVSVLFQDYTHFPLSIKENIGMGNPENANNMDLIREAARLGGAEEIIERLSEGFDTYLEKPVSDYYSGIPEGTKSLFGRKLDYNDVRRAGRLTSRNTISLSGGQMQRLAVARTFMKTLGDDPKVGLTLFDEPSASLDPAAEHDLFERLRNLRGSKTMIFSSHRFGNLTRHADQIIYMNDSQILEIGTHEELLRADGKYASIWKLQAQAFL